VIPLSSWFDAGLALVLSVLFPVYSWSAYRGFRESVRRSGSAARLREYRATIAIQWGLVLLTLIVWLAPGRELPELGFRLHGGVAGWIGLAVTAAAVGFLFYQWFAIRSLDHVGREKLHRQIDSVRDLLPRSGAEYRTFQALAITAGVCEEILYRGFLLAFLSRFVGEWPAVFIGGAIFGGAHFYQGIVGCFKTGAIGIAAGALYVLSDSLLWPVIVHAAIDLHGGAVGRLLLTTDRVDPLSRALPEA
jgi:membrane protease YdiL (CAAX protease family)